MSKGEKFESSLRRRVAAMALPPASEEDGSSMEGRRQEFIHLVMELVLACWAEAKRQEQEAGLVEAGSKGGRRGRGGLLG